MNQANKKIMLRSQQHLPPHWCWCHFLRHYERLHKFFWKSPLELHEFVHQERTNGGAKKKRKRLRLANRQESGVILKNDCQTHIHYSTGQSGRAQSPYLYRLCKSDLSSLITLKNLPLAHRQYWANITLYSG